MKRKKSKTSILGKNSKSLDYKAFIRDRLTYRKQAGAFSCDVFNLLSLTL
jgi:hypothetical protein